MATLKDLRAWMERDLARFSPIATHTQEIEQDDDIPDPALHLHFFIYTDTNRYNIHARQAGRGYLGCIASSRKPRAGEDWNRGRDLADGPLSEETWRNILADIVSYEMVRVHDPKEAMRRAEITGSAAAGPAAQSDAASQSARASSTRTHRGR